MRGHVPCAGGDRPAPSEAERAYAEARRYTREILRQIAAWSIALKKERQAFDAVVHVHGPVSSATERALLTLSGSRSQLKQRLEQLDAAEQQQDAAFRAWASEVAALQQYRTAVPRFGGSASSDGQGRPPGAGPPQCAEAK
jgi:hypothetical protein